MDLKRRLLADCWITCCVWHWPAETRSVATVHFPFRLH